MKNGETMQVQHHHILMKFMEVSFNYLIKPDPNKTGEYDPITENGDDDHQEGGS